MEKSKGGGFLKETIKGTCTAVIASLLAVLVFAFVVKLTYLNGGVIKAVNQFIKVIAVFLGCSLSIKNSMGLLKGVIIGILTSLVISLVFSLCGVGTGARVALLIDGVFTAVIGGICGVIAVNVRKGK